MTTPEATAGRENSSAATLKRAYLTMDRMRRRLDELEERERARTEPVAVIGVGCRFPGGVTDTDSYWQLLADGTDAVTEVPADRWDADAFHADEPRTPGRINTRWGGFLDRVDRFDHDFFGISRREALAMDPQQRLALEVSWEALEDAGQAPGALAGSRTGVFMGVCNADYATRLFEDPLGITAYASTGTAHSVLAGRISYALDLRGPSMAVDTACSSSLLAVHQACQALRSAECDLALAGGANTVLTPHVSISFSQFPEMLAPDGRCKTFDASANGFVRGEGCGVVVLKRLSDALRDGDRVLAVVRGSAVNQDGRSSGVTAPNGAAQRDVLRRALDAAGVAPDRVGYIEAHGTGTKLGDPIEVEALAEVYGRPAGPPVLLGSCKTNIGHLEAAAGVAGLIKAALCVDRGTVPANLHFTELNPHISFDGTTFAVPTAPTPWPREEGPRTAAVSSFGFSGTNVHLIVEQAPDRPAAAPDDRRPRSVLALSARSGTALLKLARRYQEHLAAGTAPLADVCHSANTGRSHFPHRLAVAGRTGPEVADRLAGFVRGEPDEDVALGEAAEGCEVVFLFTGQGPQRAGMAEELYRTQPTFRRIIDRCDAALRDVLPAPLLSVLYPALHPAPGPEGADPEIINRMDYAQTALFAVEYAVAELWRSWGVEPAAVLGHSLGEYAAACFAGAMPLEDGLRLVAERGRLLQTLAEDGAMAAVFAPAEDVAEVVAALGRDDRIAVACVNGPANTAVSGAKELVEAVCRTFTERGAEARRLRISTASHSPLMDPVLPPLRRALEQVRFTAPRVPVVSNLTGKAWPWQETPGPDYWCDHARRPVLFAQGVSTLHTMGHRVFLEVGPQPTLLGLTAESLPPGADPVLVPSLRQGQGDWEVLAAGLARLYAGGADIDWAAFDRDHTRTRVPVPRYAFDATRCWHTPRRDPSWTNPAPADTPADPPADDAPPRGTGRPAAPGRARPAPLPSAAEVLALPEPERAELLASRLAAAVGTALRATSDVPRDRPLTRLGLDSLMAVELRNEIHRGLGVSVTVADFLKGTTVQGLAERLAAQLGRAPRQDGPAAPERPAAPARSAAEPAIRRAERYDDVAADLLARIDDLPEEQVRAITGQEG
ncbi:hypothetical protein GCM10027168_49750 [Streptomyces capparidis]